MFSINVKQLLLFIFVGLLVVSCDDDNNSPAEQHTDAEGFLLENQEGLEIYKYFKGSVSGQITLEEGQDLELSVHFLDDDGLEITHDENHDVEDELRLTIIPDNLWDAYALNQCENKGVISIEQVFDHASHEVHCDDITDEMECISSDHCDWHNGECEEHEEEHCDDIIDEMECISSDHCDWHNGECEEHEEEHCDDIIDEMECISSNHCDWHNGVCEEHNHGSHNEHAMELHIEGINAGCIFFKLELMHGDHADYDSRHPISDNEWNEYPVKVTVEQN